MGTLSYARGGLARKSLVPRLSVKLLSNLPTAQERLNLGVADHPGIGRLGQSVRSGHERTGEPFACPDCDV